MLVRGRKNPHVSAKHCGETSKIPGAAAATWRRPVPHRWRIGDDAYLSRRLGASSFRSFRPPQGPDRTHGASRLFRPLCFDGDRSRRRLHPGAPDLARHSDWGKKLGYGAEALQRINRAAIEMMLDIRYRYETSASPMVVSGCIGPRGDGYAPGALMRPDEARDYHRPQVLTFRDAGADLVSAFTMSNIGEAQGIALAAKAANM